MIEPGSFLTFSVRVSYKTSKNTFERNSNSEEKINLKKVIDFPVRESHPGLLGESHKS